MALPRGRSGVRWRHLAHPRRHPGPVTAVSDSQTHVAPTGWTSQTLHGTHGTGPVRPLLADERPDSNFACSDSRDYTRGCTPDSAAHVKPEPASSWPVRGRP